MTDQNGGSFAMRAIDSLALNTTERIGTTMHKSRLFQVANAEGAMALIMAGQEMGFGPIASLTGIYLIKGKVAPSAALMAAAIKRSGRYDYRVREIDGKLCRIEFFERGESVGVSSFTLQEAADAGLTANDNWRKFPRNMLFSRAMSNGAKWYCPDVFAGPVYTPDELGAAVDSEGNVVDATFTPQPVEVSAAPTPAVVETQPDALTYTVDGLMQQYGEDAFFAVGGMQAQTLDDLAVIAKKLEAAKTSTGDGNA